MNYLIVDGSIRDYTIFVESVNPNTTPLVFQDTLPSADRIGFVYEHGSPLGTWLLQHADLLIASGVKQMDFLACDTLSIPTWVALYEQLIEAGIRVGASNNLTGNIQYGGDWVMESTCEDIEAIYFTKSIEYYKYLLGNSFSTMVIDDEGWVWSCGNYTTDTITQLGLGGSSAQYLTRTNMSNAIMVTAGYAISLALSKDGWVYSCGSTTFLARTGPNNLFERTNLSNATYISTGEGNPCAISNGTLYVADSQSFKSRNVSATKVSAYTPPSMAYIRGGNLYNDGHSLILSDVKDVCVGRLTTLAVKTNGDLYEASHGYAQVQSNFTKVNNMSNVTSIGAGEYHFIALVGNQLYARGDRDFFGNGTQSVYKPVPHMNNVTQIAAGERHTMALINGQVYTTGETGGQLGRTTLNTSFLPAQKIVGGVVSDMTTVAALFDNIASITSIPTPVSDPMTVTTFQPVVRNAPILLRGTNFANLSSIQFGNTFVQNFSYNASVITVKLPAVPDNVSVRVYDLDGKSVEYTTRLTPLPFFTTTAYVPPTLIPNTTLQLRGTNFSNISSVLIGGSMVQPIYNSSVSLTVTVPSTLPNNTITVFDLYGNNSTYRTPIQLTGLSSYTGYKNTLIRIYGDNLTQMRRIWFNTASTTNFYRISNTEYSVIVPDSTSGSLVVEDIFGIFSMPITFVYQHPTITSLSATTGKAKDTIFLVGQSLANIKTVYFGSIPAKVVAVSSSSITVEVPVGVGVVPIRVYDAIGNQATSSQTFQYQIVSKPVGKVQAIVRSSTANASQKYYSLLEGSQYSIAKYVNASTYQRLYNSSTPITGITYSNNRIYFCDPSANAIRSIPVAGGSATTVFTRSTMIPEAIKTNGSTLFIACRNMGVASNDAFLTTNVSGSVLSSQPYSIMTGYTLKGITPSPTGIDLYMSAVRYPNAMTATGRVFRYNTSLNMSFIQGLTNPLDLTFSNGYLIVDGHIQIYNPNGVLVATYETDANTLTEEIRVGETSISFTVNNESTATSEISQIVIPPNTGDTFQLTDQYSPVRGTEGSLVSIIGYNMAPEDILSVDISGTTITSLTANVTYFVTTNLLVIRMPTTVDPTVAIVVTTSTGIKQYAFAYGQPNLVDIIPLYRGDQRYFHFTGTNLDNIQAVEFVDNTVTELSSAKTLVRDVTSTSFNCDLPSIPLNTARCLLQDVFGNVYQEDANYFTLTSETCFLAGTPILTDQGPVAIDKINIHEHTLQQRPILAITKVKYNASTLILFPKDSIRKHYPTQDTVMSRKHKLYVKGKMKRAETVKGGIEVPYQNQYLYNVLLKTHETMNVNGLICETLYPKNPIAKYFLSTSASD